MVHVSTAFSKKIEDGSDRPSSCKLKVTIGLKYLYVFHHLECQVFSSVQFEEAGPGEYIGCGKTYQSSSLNFSWILELSIETIELSKDLHSELQSRGNFT